MSQDCSAAMLNRIRDELSTLAQFIDTTVKGFNALEMTVKMSSEKFPDASSQLSSVTGELENAANTIMTILEELLGVQDRGAALLKSLGEWMDGLEADRDRGVAIVRELEQINQRTKGDMMEIFSNMSFHDLSGQKLRKVIGSLAVVEAKLLELALNFGVGADEGPKAGAGKEPEKPIKQDVVDMLLKELGT